MLADQVRRARIAGSVVGSSRATRPWANGYRGRMDSFDVELRRMECLKDMPDAVMEWLTDHTALAVFERGAALIEEGASTRNCYFIVNGETAVTFEGQSLGTTGCGQPEGEMAMFFRQPRSATTIAVSDTVTVLDLPAEAYDELQGERPELANQFRTTLLSYLRRARGIEAADATTRANKAGVTIDSDARE